MEEEGEAAGKTSCMDRWYGKNSGKAPTDRCPAYVVVRFFSYRRVYLPAGDGRG